MCVMKYIVLNQRHRSGFGVELILQHDRTPLNVSRVMRDLADSEHDDCLLMHNKSIDFDFTEITILKP